MRAAASVSRRVWLVSLLVITVFVGAAALRLWAIANADQADIGAAPFVDDSFYYFSLGRNLAEGVGTRVDSFHQTNGFQPLWGFLVALPYLLLPDASAITAIQVMGAAFSLGAGAIIYRFTAEAARSRLAGAINAAAWLFMPYAARESINGMETSLAVFGLLLAAWLYYRFYAQPTRQRLIAAALASGFAVMARVDLALFTAATILLLLVLPPAGYQALTQRARLVITFGLIALIPALPWVIFSLALGKLPLPESGAAVRELALHYLGGAETAEGQSLVLRNAVALFLNGIRNFVIWIAPLRRGIFADFYLYLIALGVVGVIVFVRRQSVWQTLISAFGMLALLAVAYIFVIPVYWYYERYLHPLVALLSMLIGIVLAQWVIELRGRRVGWIIALAYAALVVYFGVFLVYRGGTGTIAARVSHLEYDVTMWINENLTGADVLIGSYQSGLIGYYLEPRHFNLDGVVNEDAYAAIAAENGWGYVCAAEITHLVEQPRIMAGILNADRGVTPVNSNDPIEILEHFGEIVLRRQIPAETAFNSDYVVLAVDRSQCPE